MSRIIIAAEVAILILTASYAQGQHSEKDKEVVRRVFIDILSQGKFEAASDISPKTS